MLRLHTLGDLRLAAEDGEALARGRKELALLAYLARQPGRAFPRTKVAEFFWGEHDDDRARHSLRQALHFLKRVIGDAIVVTQKDVTLAPGRVELDSMVFEQLVAAGEHRRALALWNGPFLGAILDLGSSAAEDWAAHERARLQGVLDGAFEALANDAERRRAWQEYHDVVARWAQEAPLDERANARVVRAALLAGRVDEAAHAYQSFVDRIEEKPSRSFARLQDEIAAARDAQSWGRELAAPRRPVRAADVVAAWKRARRGKDATLFFRRDERQLVENAVSLAVESEPAAVLRVAGSDTDAAWAGARRLAAQLVDLPGLAGTPPELLAEIVELAPPLRDRFPQLPRGSGAATALSRAMIQGLTDVAWERPVVLLVEDYAALDAESAALMATIARTPPASVLVLLESGATPDAETESVVARSRRAVRYWPLAAASVALVALAAAMIVGDGRAAAVTPGRLVVLPFTALGNPAPEYLSEGMPSLLSATLDGAGAVRAIDPYTAMRSAANDADVGRNPARFARELGAEFYVRGTVMQSRNRLRLQASLFDVDHGAEPVTTAATEGNADQLFALVDTLSLQLLRGISAEEDTPLVSLATRTTGSLAALKEYLTGEQKLRHGDESGALASFGSALAKDTTFALAAYRVTVAAEWAARPDLAFDALPVLERPADGASDRDRLLFQARAAQLRGQADDAERAYRVLVGNYPDFTEAWMQLGETVYHSRPMRGEPFTLSRGAFERVLELDPENFHALIHLARIAAWSRDEQRLRELTDLIEELSSGTNRGFEARALSVHVLGADADRAAFFAAQRSATDFYLSHGAWALAVPLQNLPTAEQWAYAAPARERDPSVRAGLHRMAAQISAARGRWQSARAALGRSVALDSVSALEYSAMLAAHPFYPARAGEIEELRARLRSWRPELFRPRPVFDVLAGVHPLATEYVLGLLAARQGDTAAATHARRAGAMRGPSFAPDLGEDLAQDIRAHLALTVPDSTRALADLVLNAFPRWYSITYRDFVYSQGHERFVRAELLRRSGQYDLALALYSSFTHGDLAELPYVAPGHLRAAQIYETLGDTARAAQRYRRFLDLWADADPEVQPIVRTARAKVKVLGARR